MFLKLQIFKKEKVRKFRPNDENALNSLCRIMVTQSDANKQTKGLTLLLLTCLCSPLSSNYMTAKDSRKLSVNNRILFQLMDNPYFQTKVEGIKTNSEELSADSFINRQLCKVPDGFSNTKT